MEVNRSVFRARIGIGKDQTQDAAHDFWSSSRRAANSNRLTGKRGCLRRKSRPGRTRAWLRAQVQTQSKEGVGAEIGYSFARGDRGRACRTKRAVEGQEGLFLQLLKQVRVAVAANERHEVEKAVATDY